MVNSANVRVTTGNPTADTILKWGFWIGIGLATYRLYRVVRYDDPFIQPSYRLPPAWEANPRFSHNTLSDEKKALASALYEPGDPVGPVAEAVGVSTTTIIRWMKEAGRYEASREGPRDTAAYERALELYEPGEPVGPVAEAVGVSTTTIVDWMKKAGIYEAAPAKRPRDYSSYTKAYKRALELYEPGEPVGPVAKAVGVYPTTIVNWMKKAGIYEAAPVGPSLGPQDKAAYKRALELYEPGEPVGPVAEAVGVDKSTIINWMKKAGIYEAAPLGRGFGQKDLDEKRALAFALYEPGEPVRPVAKAVGVSINTIIRWMKEAGRYEVAREGPRDEAAYKRALELYEPGKPVGPVAEAVGVSPVTIINWMKKAGRYEAAPGGSPLGPRDEAAYERALELYEPGEPVGPVAEAVGVSPVTIINWMKKAGRYEAVELHPLGPRDTAAYERALELYKPGKPVGPVAEAVGVSPVTIINWMKKAGIYEAVPAGYSLGPRDEAAFKKALELYKPGEPVGPVAKAVGVSSATIINWMKKAGIYETDRVGREQKDLDDKMMLAFALYKPGKPVGPVAKAVGVDPTTIIDWMKKAGRYKAVPVGGRGSQKKPSKNPWFMNGLSFF